MALNLSVRKEILSTCLPNVGQVLSHPTNRKPHGVLRVLHKAARKLLHGTTAAVICDELGISLSTFQRWRRHYKTVEKLKRESANILNMSDLQVETGFTRRSVASLIRLGLLDPPTGFGHRSHYDTKHILRLRLITVLKRAGISQDDMSDVLAGISPARERAIVKAAGKLGWGQPRVMEWLEERL